MKNIIKKLIKEELQTLFEITSKEAKQKYYQDIDDSLYNTIINLDPTYNPQNDNLTYYSRWLLRKENVNIIKKTREEDLYKIRDDISFYDKAKRANALPTNVKDINKLDIIKLSDVVFELGDEDIQSNTEKEKQIKKDAKKYELKDWLVILPETKEAACYYGKGTRWCTASEEFSAFEGYYDRGKLYILINKQDPSDKYQLHFEDAEFMNPVDKPVDAVKFFNENNEVYEFLKKLVSNDKINFLISLAALKNRDEAAFIKTNPNDFEDIQKMRLLTKMIEYENYYVRDDYDKHERIYLLLKNVDFTDLKKYFGQYIKESFIGFFSDCIHFSSLSTYDKNKDFAIDIIDILGGFKIFITYVKRNMFMNPAGMPFRSIELFYQVAQNYDNGVELLNSFYGEISIVPDIFQTINMLKNKFKSEHGDWDWNKGNYIFESDICSLAIKRWTSYVDGLLEIICLPKDPKTNYFNFKKEFKAKISYKDIIKYLTIPNYGRSESLNESIKKIILEQITKTKIICDNCNWSWKIKDGGKDLYVCHKCGHDNTPKKKLNEEKLPENRKGGEVFPYKGDEYLIQKEKEGQISAFSIINNENVPLETIPNQNLKSFQNPLTVSKDVVKNADITKPIIIGDTGYAYFVLDGNHRLTKAMMKGKDIQAYVLSPEQTEKIKLKYGRPKNKIKEEEIILNEKCWKGYTQKGMKTMFGKKYPNCVKSKK